MFWATTRPFWPTGSRIAASEGFARGRIRVHLAACPCERRRESKDFDEGFGRDEGGVFTPPFFFAAVCQQACRRQGVVRLATLVALCLRPLQ